MNALSRPLSLCLLLLSLAPLACSPTDPKDPATWIGHLEDADARKRAQAMQELRKLKAKQAAAPIALLLKESSSREDAALALGDLGGPEQVQPLIDAIDTTVGAGSDQATRAANRTNAKLADALGLLADARACPSLLRLARAKDDLVRLSAVQSIGLCRCKEAAAELSRMVDDATVPPILVKKAIVALGQIGDPSAIGPLLHAMVLERQGISFLSESSYALLLIGAPSFEPLMKLLGDQDPAWSKWAKENNRAPAGTYAKAEIVLGDLGDARAEPALLAKLKYTDPDPLPDTSHMLTNVVRQFAADALGRLRVKSAAAPIAAIASAKAGDEDLAFFSATALVLIGDRAQAKELLKKAQSGAIKARLTLAQGAALLGEPALLKELEALAAKERKGSAAECEKSATELNGAPLADASGACEKVAQAFVQLEAPLQAAQACASGDAAAQTSCWTQKLADKSPLVRARAAYELGTLSQPSAVPALLKGCTDEDLSARLAAIRATEWFLTNASAKEQLKAAAPVLQAQLLAEAGRLQYVKVDEELKRLQLKLSRL